MKPMNYLLLFFLLVSLALPPAPAQAEGENAYSLRFYGHGTDGIDRLRIPIDPPTIADTGRDFTLEFWLRALPEENSGQATCNAVDGWITGNTIFDRDIWGNGDYGDWGVSLSQGRIAFGVTQGTRGTTLCGSVNVADGVWHHIAITRHFNGLMRIFVDGSLDRQGYGPRGDIGYRDGRDTAYPNDPYLVIGAEKHDAGSEFPSFSGWLDEVRLSTSIRYHGNFALPTQPFTPDAKTAVLYHFDSAAASGACDAVIPDASGHVDAECLYGGSNPAGPEYSPSTPFADGQRLAVPSYFYPPSFWPQLTSASPTVGLAIVNPESGPGAEMDPNYLEAVRQAQREGILTLGYVATGYGLRSLTTVQNEIQRYFTWYDVNGIFLDEASNSCSRAAYYQRLYAHIKRIKPGARVVLNPGTNTPECYIKTADVLLNFEGDFDAYQNWMPEPWVYKYDPQRFWHLIYAANQNQMSEAMRLSKGRQAGWVYVTDDTLPNPWDTLPGDPYWTEEQNAVRSPFWAADFQKGVSYAAWWNDLYATPDSDLVLNQLLPANGVEWISLVVTCYQPTLASTSIDCSLNRTPSDASLIHAIQTAHAQGLKVMLKPHVDINDNSGWRGQINFGDNEEAWNTWFDNYTAFITRYANLAQEQGVELFAVGTELEGTTHRENDWRNVIAAVRAVYGGPLTYAANWGGEETAIQWWDALDFIGVDAYYPLTGKTNPTRAELRAAWEPHIATLSALSSTWGKPILLTEIGYRSIDGANRDPWNWSRVGPADLQEQADCYLVALDLFAGQAWLKGIYWWTWSPTDPGESNPRNRRYKFYLREYSVYRKPAEGILRAFYTLP